MGPLLQGQRSGFSGICATLRGEDFMTTIQIKVPNWLDKIFAWPVMLYRRMKYGYTYRQIYLGEDKFTIVEPADFCWLNNYHWSARRNKSCIYAVRFLTDDGKKSKFISMHREIMNPRKGLLVDHRNNDGLDNRRQNLRFATHSQNMHNRRKKRNTTSQYRGVWLTKGKYESQLTHRGKRIDLGRFDSEIEAARAYDAAARKYHKEFARLNFPSES
jgi:hypothetical protein